MSHSIDRKTIAELLNGDTYVIPAYQRGYRWTKDQVDDLLNDLLDYSYDGEVNGFYCLQPLILQKRGGQWELVDGQQRITTLVILLKALLQLENLPNEAVFSESYGGKKLMSVVFDTHPDDNAFLANIGAKTRDDVNNINQKHMFEAYQEILRWFRQDAPSLCRVSAVRRIADAFLEILAVDALADTRQKNVQVIWYQLDESDDVNPIREFLRINSGRIPLTDSELVKALLLQRRGLGGDETTQIQHALEWERMENALVQPAFWAMISKDPDASDRMREILGLIVQQGGESAKQAKGELFRSFVDMAKRLSTEDIWNSIITRFMMLESWFSDPVVYNYVGLLSHFGHSLHQISANFDALKRSSNRKDFISALEAMLKKSLARKVKESDGQIVLTFDKDKTAVRHVLLFVNVMQSIRRVEEREKESAESHTKESETDDRSDWRDSGFFKFPFAIFDAQHWNVEHVDSATANSLKKAEDRVAWIAEAKKYFPGLSSDETALQLERDGQDEALIEHIQRQYDCGDDDPEDKARIGNLVLLDEKTNKSYGNHVFAVKAAVINERDRLGVFVPICTQWVFGKTIDGCSRNDMLKWTPEDKNRYHDFIKREIEDFKARP